MKKNNKLKLKKINNLNYAKKKSLQKCKGKESEAMTLSILMHEYSNYHDLQWSLYKYDEEVVLKELTNLLVEISSRFPQLTWACMDKLEKYQKEYSIRSLRSQYVQN